MGRAVGLTLSVWQLVLALQGPPDVCGHTDGVALGVGGHLFLWSVAAVAYCVDIVDPNHLQGTAHLQAPVGVELGVVWLRKKVRKREHTIKTIFLAQAYN